MKRAILAVVAVSLFSAVGCQAIKKDPCKPGLLSTLCNPNTGDNTDPYHVGHPGLCGKHQQQVIAPGPAAPTYGYPYYTVRGPRDFLVDNPPSIGP